MSALRPTWYAAGVIGAKLALQDHYGIGSRPRWQDRAIRSPNPEVQGSLEVYNKAVDRFWNFAVGEYLEDLTAVVWSVVHRTDTMERDDVKQTIALKLREVCETYDPEKGSFWSYATSVMWRTMNVEVGRHSSPYTLSRDEARSRGRSLMGGGHPQEEETIE